MTVCTKCGREIHNPESVKNGMGPVCAGKTQHKSYSQGSDGLDPFFPKLLDPDLAELFLKQLQVLNCKSCGTPLPRAIKHYEHEGGWEVLGFQKKQWLFIECLNCEHEWSLNKLGVMQ